MTTAHTRLSRKKGPVSAQRRLGVPASGNGSQGRYGGRLSAKGTTWLRPDRYSMKAKGEPGGTNRTDTLYNAYSSEMFPSGRDARHHPRTRSENKRPASAQRRPGGHLRAETGAKADTEGRLSAKGTTWLRPNRYSTKAKGEARGHHPHRHPLQRTHPPNVPEHLTDDHVTYIAKSPPENKGPASAQRRPGGHLRAEAGAKADTEGRLSAKGTTWLRPNRYSTKAKGEARGHHPHRHPLQRRRPPNVPARTVTHVNTRKQ